MLERQETGGSYRFHFDIRGIDWSVFQWSDRYPNTQVEFDTVRALFDLWQTSVAVRFELDRSIKLWKGEVQAELYTGSSEVQVLFKKKPGQD